MFKNIYFLHLTSFSFHITQEPPKVHLVITAIGFTIFIVCIHSGFNCANKNFAFDTTNLCDNFCHMASCKSLHSNFFEEMT